MTVQIYCFILWLDGLWFIVGDEYSDLIVTRIVGLCKLVAVN
jgi:hypothetical protein